METYSFGSSRVLAVSTRIGLFVDNDRRSIWLLPGCQLVRFETYWSIALGWLNISIGILVLRGKRRFDSTRN